MFLDKDFLLTTDFSRKLFHNHAEKMPIIDYHCHLNPKEIYENQNFRDLAQVWINEGNYGDHYKWRLMRANGVPEKYITGDAEPYEKFLKWAETIEKSVGNPLYEWTHLELRRFFGIETILNRQTAPEIWEKANQLLATEDFKPRNLIKIAMSKSSVQQMIRWMIFIITNCLKNQKRKMVLKYYRLSARTKY